MRHEMAKRTRALLAAVITAIVVLAAVPASTAALHAAAPGTCVRKQLAAQANGGEGAAGTIYNKWVLTNVSKTKCTLSGYPSIALYGKRGRPIATIVKRDLPPGPAVVTLAPGGSARFLTSYSDVPSSRRPCPASSVMQITPPGVEKSLFIPAVLGPCRGLVHVSAVRARIQHG